MARIDYNGASDYISSGYTTTQVPEATTLWPQACVGSGEVAMNPSWEYAEFSEIHSGVAVLYRSEAANPGGITVYVDVGHGAKGGISVKTQYHPDGTPKIAGDTITAAAVSGGIAFTNGAPEDKVTLPMAKILGDKLLATGYDI